MAVPRPRRRYIFTSIRISLHLEGFAQLRLESNVGSQFCSRKSLSCVIIRRGFSFGKIGPEQAKFRRNFARRGAQEEETMWHVYILRCADGILYTGSTTDIDRRVKEHNHKKVERIRFDRSTRYRKI